MRTPLLVAALLWPALAAAQTPLQRAYQSIDLATYNPRARSEGYLQSAGVTGPLRAQPNPDPQWITMWGANSLGNSDMADAVVQAALNRAWQKACYDDYAAWRAAWRTIDATARPELERLKQPGSFYARADGLRELYTRVKTSAEEAHAHLPDMHPQRWAGIEFEIAAALVALYRDGGHEYAAASVQQTLGADFGHFASDGRALAADDTLERDFFCAFAQRNGTQRTKPLPDIQPSEPRIIRPVVSNEAIARVNALLTESQKSAPAAFAFESHRVPTLGSGSADHDPKEPKLAHTGPVVVRSVRTAGGVTTVVAGRQKKENESFGCHGTKQIESIDANGYVRNRVECKPGTRETNVNVTLTFSELPPNLTLQKGDEISVYGDVEKSTSKKKEAKLLLQFTDDYVITARQLTEVQRSGAAVARY